MRRFRLAASAALLFALVPCVPAAASAASPRCRGHAATIVGTAGSDRLVGTRGRDVIVGRGGADRIRARGGNDLICAGGAADDVHAGAGSDRVYGGARWDTIHGDRGNDRLFGGPGSDTLHGGSGADYLAGNQDAYYYDRAGQERAGDRLDGGPGNDVIAPGFDTRHANGPSVSPDMLDYSRSAHAIHVDLSRAAGIVTGEGTDRVRVDGPLRVFGSRHDDSIIGSAYADTLEGGPGADRIDGESGADEISADGDFAYDNADDIVNGGPGDDDIRSNGGHDTLAGASGNDGLYGYGQPYDSLHGGPGEDYLFFFYRSENAEVVRGGTGRDQLDIQVQGGSDNPDVTMRVDLRAASGTVISSRPGAVAASVRGIQRWVFGSSQPWSFDGSDGPDSILWPGSAATRLSARTYAGDDEVTGTPGNDHIDTGAGVDTVDGRKGRDVCVDAEHVTGCESS